MLKWAIRAEDRNILPLSGGGLDQTQSFLQAWDFVSGELRNWRTKLGIKRG